MSRVLGMQCWQAGLALPKPQRAESRIVTGVPFSVPHLSLAPRSTPTRRRTTPTQAILGGNNDKLNDGLDDVKRLLSKYAGGGDTSGRPSFSSSSRSPSSPTGMGDGVFYILIINFALHLAAYFWSPAWMAALPLSHWAPHWWQFITAAFVHANWEHLLGNAFSLLVFGRVVEEEEGAFGVWATYLLCGIGGNLASFLSSPGSRSVSLGASSAVFGLFVVGVLTKLRPNAKRLLEAVILGSFVLKQVLGEVHMVASGKALAAAGGMSVGHFAHLGGALAGVLLVWGLSRLPAASGKD